MKRPTLSHLIPALLVFAAFAAGCGDDPVADPEVVIQKAFAADQGAAEPVEATVEVASLGFEDRVLESQLLSIDPDTYVEVQDAIAGSGSEKGGDEDGGGLLGLAINVETVGTEDLDGTQVDHVAGEFDVATLVDELESASTELGAGSTALPGLGELDELRETLVAADFDLYAESGNGDFERLDLTLSLDDRQNALPPTRIRFSLTETDPEQASI
ncbi:MAG: hypothetical protein ACSLFI_09405 [Solirubrobacterales bacterium]